MVRSAMDDTSVPVLKFSLPFPNFINRCRIVAVLYESKVERIDRQNRRMYINKERVT